MVFNDELYIDEQDEEIILAKEINLALILELVDDPVTLRSKKQTLYAALCVLIYDSINSNNKLLELVRTELIKRKEDFLKTEPFIMDYIRKKVFPIIGLE
ncbi:MAG TPA: hypothetical protein VK177_04510 [Flavobacteriales bacterium]|nr:hypothetical protein [Flavobacteriales bacterium]